MYCVINSQKITEEYGISSLDFGGDCQPLIITYYYLQEALKCQKLKVAGVEIFKIFDASVSNENITYSYSVMPVTLEKYNSLKTILVLKRSKIACRLSAITRGGIKLI